MKNLFNYATKELSQDAFLCWFFVSYQDQRIKQHVYEFINELTGLKLNVGDIKDLTIKQQAKNIDIVVDFWTSENKSKTSESHYVIIIEDKTYSSAHGNQLKRYSDEMSKWNKDEPGREKRRFKVFYKSSFLSDQDRKELDYSDNYSEDKSQWVRYTIVEINKFFTNISNSGSEILDSYAEHVKTIYNDLNEISPNLLTEWNLINFQTFCQKIYDKEFKDKYDCHFETWQYQGRLASGAFYYHPKSTNTLVTKKYPCFAYPIVEFVFRKNTDSLVVYTHITYHWVKELNNPEKDDWSWKIKQYGGPFKKEAEAFMDKVVDSLSTNKKLKTRNMKVERNQTISVENMPFKGEDEKLISNNDIEKNIIQKVEQYFNVFKEADERQQ